VIDVIADLMKGSIVSSKKKQWFYGEDNVTTKDASYDAGDKGGGRKYFSCLQYSITQLSNFISYMVQSINKDATAFTIHYIYTVYNGNSISKYIAPLSSRGVLPQ